MTGKKKGSATESESKSKLLSLVEQVSEVVGEPLAYSLCDILKCDRSELSKQRITNAQLHAWYQSMMYQIQRYHWRHEDAIQALQTIIKSNADAELLN